MPKTQSIIKSNSMCLLKVKYHYVKSRAYVQPQFEKLGLRGRVGNISKYGNRTIPTQFETLQSRMLGWGGWYNHAGPLLIMRLMSYNESMMTVLYSIMAVGSGGPRPPYLLEVGAEPPLKVAARS